MSDCCIFAGQGAQVPGMGKDFAEADAEAMALFDKANAVLGFDLKKICFEGPAEELTKSNVCQPAIFVTSYAAYCAFQKKRPTTFACAAGLSLGEWGALCAAGVLDFDATLTVLEARGRFMQEACAATPSGMIAIVGASPDQLRELCEKTGCTVANINSAAQQVLSGSKDAILECYGKVGCTAAQLAEVAPGDLLRVRKGPFGCEGLTADREAFRRGHPGLTVDPASLEDIMLLIGKGEPV